MKDWKLWTGLLALFLSGVCVGGVGAWIVAEHRIVSSLTHERPHFHKAIVRKLSRELGLDEQQRQRVSKIVCRTQEELVALRERTRPERDEILRRGRQSLKVELDEAQQRKLDELFDKFEKHRNRAASGRSRPEGAVDDCE